MSNNALETAKQTSPVRPRHQVTRSITEVSAASVNKIQRSHHHHPHIHAHLHRRDKDEKASHSANPNLLPNELFEGTRSEAITPAESRNVSRRPSISRSAKEVTDTLGLADSLHEKPVVKEGEVNEEREKGILRATELRKSLTELNTLSNIATRRLDNIYYAVLEKLSVLQSMIASFKELATATRQLNEEFKTESEEMVEYVETELNVFGGFDVQQKNIELLQERVGKGREKIKILGGRVDILRERVEGWEKAEREWQETMRKRLRILWIVMAVCAVMFIALVVSLYTPARSYGPAVMKGLSTSRLAGELPGLEEIKNESSSLERAVVNTWEKLQPKDKFQDSIDDDPRLRVFDEL